MNTLDQVKIENTFRIKASSAIEAAKAATPSHMEYSHIDHVTGEDGVFIVTSKISDTVYHSVVFIESVNATSFRVEIGSVRLSEIEVTWLIGGDDAVNEIGFYKSETRESIISHEEYSRELSYWIENDIKENTPNRMEEYIRRNYKKIEMVNGEFKID